MKVFEIKELRKEIFSYLRTKPYVSCACCKVVCQWDKLGTVRRPSVLRYGSTQCNECFQYIETYEHYTTASTYSFSSSSSSSE